MTMQQKPAGMNRREMLRIAGGAALGSAALLAGCGEATSSGSTQKITLNHWYSAAGEAGTKEAVLRYAADYSKAHPNVEVKVTWIPGDYTTKLNAALLSPNPPDIFELGPGPTVDGVKAGLYASLDDLFTPEVKAGFHPQDISIDTVNGHIYGLKDLEDFTVLYYRKSLLQKAGVKPPTTLDELITASKALTTGKMKGLYLGNDLGNFQMALMLPWSAGAGYLTADNSAPAFNTPEVANAFLKARKLYQSGTLLNGAPTDWYDPGAFTSELCAMQFTGLWAYPTIAKAFGDDIEVLPWPASSENGKPAIWWAGWSQLISAKSKHIAEAKAYIKSLWIDNNSVQKDWNTAYGFHVPPRLDVVKSADTLKSGPPAEAADFLSKYGQFQGPYWNGAMGTAYGNAYSNVVQKN
ncbi:MAG TPA: sugar ABC transporter substrate-binding protein, partial [Ktedonobacteraceae bacterium]|nr:sugar ABC transporter substrate-binding protein [Ktedonobacteraceae bacterium]